MGQTRSHETLVSNKKNYAEKEPQNPLYNITTAAEAFNRIRNVYSLTQSVPNESLVLRKSNAGTSYNIATLQVQTNFRKESVVFCNCCLHAA